MFLHVVAAAFLEMRHSVFSCKNYDDLLQLCSRMPAQQFSVSRLLAKAKVLLSKTRGVGEAKFPKTWRQPRFFSTKAFELVSLQIIYGFIANRILALNVSRCHFRTFFRNAGQIDAFNLT